MMHDVPTTPEADIGSCRTDVALQYHRIVLMWLAGQFNQQFQVLVEGQVSHQRLSITIFQYKRPGSGKRGRIRVGRNNTYHVASS